MKHMLSLALAVCLLFGPALAEEAAGSGEEELLAVEEAFAVTEEEPAVEEEVFAVEEEFSVEELSFEAAIEEIEEIAETEELPLEIEEAQEEAVLESGIWGTCQWEIDANHTLTVHRGTGEDNIPSRWKTVPISTIDMSEPIVLPADCADLFSGMKSCTAIDLSGADASRVTNMANMFKDCSKLESLDLSRFDTARVTDMSSMFSGCTGLASLDVSGFDTHNVVSMASMFYGCGSAKLTTLDLSSFSTSKVTDMTRMFAGCPLLELDLSHFDVSAVTDMTAMFSNCQNLRKLSLAGWNAVNVTSMANMFYYCYRMGEVNLTGFRTEKVTDLSRMFYCCTSSQLAVLDLSGFSTAYVTDMSEMFYKCTADSLDLSSFDTRNVTDMSSMFEYAHMESVDLSGFTGPKVKTMDSMFRGCRYLVSVNLHGFTTARAVDADRLFSGCSSLVSLDLGGARGFRVSSAASLIGGCASLTELDLSGVDLSAIRDLSSFFAGCASLVHIDLSMLNVQNVTGMRGMFSGCTKLESVDFRGLDTSLVTDMSSLFLNCTGLRAIDLTGLNTAMVQKMNGMFSGCTGLTTLDLSGLRTGSVTDMSSMFYNCQQLQSVDLSSFSAARPTSVGAMFHNCYALRSLDLSSLNTKYAAAMGGMFNACDALKAITLGAGFSFKGSGRTVLVTLPGKGWYARSDGQRYTPDEIAQNHRAQETYSISPIGTPSYVWAQDSTSVTALMVSPDSADPLVSETVATTAEITLPATWTAMGETTYTAVFTHPAFETQTRTVTDVPRLPLEAVTGISANPVDTNASRIQWARTAGAEGYQLWRSANGGSWKWIKNCTTPVVNNYSLTPGADYRYKVRAYAGSGDDISYGPYSDEVSVHIPGKIANFTVTGKDTNCSFLKWDRVEGCTGYQVFRTVAGSGEYTWLKNATTPQVANYSLTPGTTYYYKVRAYVDLPGGGRAYGPYSAGVKIAIQPQVRAVVKGGSRQIKVSWTRAAGATGYQIFYTEAGTGGEYRWWKNIPAGTLTETLTGLKRDTEYWFKVRSYVDLPDGSRYYGQLSEAVHARTAE